MQLMHKILNATQRSGNAHPPHTPPHSLMTHLKIAVHLEMVLKNSS